jgi:hypothetical protein
MAGGKRILTPEWARSEWNRTHEPGQPTAVACSWMSCYIPRDEMADTQAFVE